MDLWMFILNCGFSLLIMYMRNRLFREWRLNSDSAFGSLLLHSLICIENISLILQRTDHSLLVILQWAFASWSGHWSVSHVLLVMKIRFCKKPNLSWMVKKHLMVDEAFLFCKRGERCERDSGICWSLCCNLAIVKRESAIIWTALWWYCSAASWDLLSFMDIFCDVKKDLLWLACYL